MLYLSQHCTTMIQYLIFNTLYLAYPTTLYLTHISHPEHTRALHTSCTPPPHTHAHLTLHQHISHPRALAHSTLHPAIYQPHIQPTPTHTRAHSTSTSHPTRTTPAHPRTPQPNTHAHPCTLH